MLRFSIIDSVLAALSTILLLRITSATKTKTSTHHIIIFFNRARRAMDLRTLFSEMCDGKHGTRERLSKSRLARGLRHAGLPLDRTVVNQLAAAYSTAVGRSSGGGLSYTDFHRMVHSKGLAVASLAGGGAAGAGGSDLQGTLDEKVHVQYS